MISSKLINLHLFHLISRGLTPIFMLSMIGILFGQGASEEIKLKKTSSGLDIYYGEKVIAEFSHTQTPQGRPFLCNIHSLDGI